MLIRKGGVVYIMTNFERTTLYTGVTSDLVNRVKKHKSCFYPNSFSARYKLFYLVHYEQFSSIAEAVEREKQIKKYRREKKIRLIESTNPEWSNLWEEVSKW